MEVAAAPKRGRTSGSDELTVAIDVVSSPFQETGAGFDREDR